MILWIQLDTKGEVMNYVGIDIGSTASKVVTRGDCQMQFVLPTGWSSKQNSKDIERRYLRQWILGDCRYKILMRSICKALKEQVEDAQFYWRVSARYRKNRLRMRNFTGEHPHVIENVGCRCKICEGSIFKSQKRQDVDAI